VFTSEVRIEWHTPECCRRRAAHGIDKPLEAENLYTIRDCARIEKAMR
jgi:hypothetical protein